jgi:hypothetical protein
LLGHSGDGSRAGKSSIISGTASTRLSIDRARGEKLDEDVWKDKPIIVFTTTLMPPRDATDEQKRNQDKWDWGAGRKLRDLAKSRRLNAVERSTYGSRQKA